MTARPLATATAAFEALAPEYDAQLSAAVNPLMGMMRDRVYKALGRHFAPPDTLLELGCGTGEDTLELAARGHRLVACDPSPAMIGLAGAKLAGAGRGGAVRFVNAGVTELAARWPSLGLGVDGAFSNFAPLNCELTLAPLRRLLEAALAPGRRFVAVVLPRICPMEVALHLARGRARAALRRFARHPTGEVEGLSFPMRYYGARDVDRALGGGFRRIETRSLGLVLPPLAFGPDFGRVPGLLDALAVVEDRLSALPGLRRMGDHLLLAYERLPAAASRY